MKWIPTSERLPEKETFVLCWDPDDQEFFVGQINDKGEWVAEAPYAVVEGWDGWMEGETPNVTHWMPLPAPPPESIQDIGMVFSKKSPRPTLPTLSKVLQLIRGKVF